MKRNRKIPKKMSVLAANTMNFGAVLVVAVAMIILHQLASTSCTQLIKSIGEKERELARLEDARTRESLRWEEMKTPEKIETALLRHGLKMGIPRPDQFVRLREDGTPYPGQLAVIRAKQRQTAMNSPESADRTDKGARKRR